MDTPVLLRQVRSGSVTLRFHAAVLAATTTERAGAPRWTELTVYRLPLDTETDSPRGEYVVAKVGRTVVAHRPDCPKAAGREWVACKAGGEHRVACLTCCPNLEDPGTLLENTRHLMLRARAPKDLLKVLLQGRPGTPQMATPSAGFVMKTIRQVRLADPDFDRHCAETLDNTMESD